MAETLTDPTEFAQEYQPIEKPAPYINDGVVKQSILLDTGRLVLLQANNIRKEKTGVHAEVSVDFNDSVLAYDTFNIKRDDGRDKLARSASKQFPTEMNGYNRESLKHDIDEFCKALWQIQIESTRGVMLEGASTLQPPVFTLHPYIIEGGGTIMFSPPGSGKSYLAMLMAVSVDSGIDTLWQVTKSRVLFINLERSEQSMKRRLRLVNEALGLPATRPLLFLNARGMALNDVVDSALDTMKQYEAQVIFLDSISRSGLGDLNDNSAANRIIDALNQTAPTWLAIAHTPRSDDTHVYGSVHFEAGSDIMLQMLTQEKENALGIGLKMTKANDVSKAGMRTYTLEFEEHGLVAARKARDGEFGELSLKVKRSLTDMVKDYLDEVSEATAKEIAEAIEANRSNVSSLLSSSEDFVRTKKEGRNQYYGIRYCQ